MPISVAIVGAGYAGSAAAVMLSRSGYNVTVFEAGPVAGGRARHIQIKQDGVEINVDNGQHLFIGAYTETLKMMRLVGLDPDQAMLRLPLDLDMSPRFRLTCPRLPAPLHALTGLISAVGLTWIERIQATSLMIRAQMRGYRLQEDQTVSSWLESNSQSANLIECLWEPLTLAALNTPIRMASAQVLLNVLRDSLGAQREDSDFLLAKRNLSALFPDAAMDYVIAHNGDFFHTSMVREIHRDRSGWHLDRSERVFDALVIALPPHRLNMLACNQREWIEAISPVRDWTYQPIATVYLGYPPGTRLHKPMLGMLGTTGQWIFDRGAILGEDGVMSVVISAEGSHSSLTQNEFGELIVSELKTHVPYLPEPLWHRVINEKRATFSCTPGLIRPSNDTDDASLWLAGDYTKGDYPATIEGAVRSGITAAQGLIAAGRLAQGQ